jgi:hypothetical protein
MSERHISQNTEQSQYGTAFRTTKRLANLANYIIAACR